MGTESRRHERYPIKLSAIITRGKQRIEATTFDVSFSGLFLNTPTPPPLRELVRIQMMLPPGNRAIELLGMAVHVVTPDKKTGRPGGVGVQLFGLDAKIRDTWERWVMELRHRPPEVKGAVAAAPRSKEKSEGQKDEWADGTPVFQSIRPELRIRLAQVSDFDTVESQNQAKGQLFVRTEMSMDPGANLRLVFVDPDAAESLALEATVLKKLRTPQFSGLAVLLRGAKGSRELLLATGQPESADIHITIDVFEEEPIAQASNH